MLSSMLISAWVMGLVGGPHCVAMCGAACAGIARGAGECSTSALCTFQVSRMAGYGLMGALAGGTVEGLAWMGAQTVVLRPIWTLMHVAAFLLGLMLLWQARQPAFLEDWGQRIWRKVRPLMTRLGGRAPWVLGVAWAFMPCGLLYSALLVASLSAGALSGAFIMVTFSLGTMVSLVAGPWLLMRLQRGRSGAGGMRLAGVALMATSGWALWMGITQPTGLWCA